MFVHGKRGELLTFHASQRWNPCDDECPYSFRGSVCLETPMLTPMLSSPPTPASTLNLTPTLAPTAALTQSKTTAEGDVYLCDRDQTHFALSFLDSGMVSLLKDCGDPWFCGLFPAVEMATSCITPPLVSEERGLRPSVSKCAAEYYDMTSDDSELESSVDCPLDGAALRAVT